MRHPKRKWILILFVLIPISLYLYSERDIFKSNDNIIFIETPEALLRSTKIYVFTNSPTVVEYKNGQLYDEDGNQGILIADGIRNTIPKHYRHADFFIIVDGKYFYNSLEIDKADTNEAYDIELCLHKLGSGCYISGNVVHNNETTISFKNHPMSTFVDHFKITSIPE